MCIQSRYFGGKMNTKKGGFMMLQLPVKQWGNSHAIRLPKSVLEALEVEKDDELNVEIVNHSIVLTKAEKDLTFQELFKGYDGEKFTSELQNLSPVGNEKW